MKLIPILSAVVALAWRAGAAVSPPVEHSCVAEESPECGLLVAQGDAADFGLLPDVADAVEDEAVAVMRMSLLQTSLHVSRDHYHTAFEAAHSEDGASALAPPTHAPPQGAAGAESVVALRDGSGEAEVPAAGVATESDIEEQFLEQVKMLPASKLALLESTDVAQESSADVKGSGSSETAGEVVAVPASKIVIPQSVAAAAKEAAASRGRTSAKAHHQAEDGLRGRLNATLKSSRSVIVGWFSGRRSDASDEGRREPETALVEAVADSSQAGRSSVPSSILTSVFDGPHDGVDGIAMLLICMLAFLVGIVFLIQVVGWTMEDKDTTYQGCAQPERRHSTGFPRYARPEMKPSPAPSAYAYAASAPGTGYGPEGMPSGAFDPLPTDTGTLKGRTSPNLGGTAMSSFFAGDAGLERGLMDRPSVGPDPRRSIEVAQDAICPALILPHGDARFSIPADSVHKLGIGRYPVEILGPSGRPLLHARLPVQPMGGRAESGGGRWLELTTTATSRYPHACVGPVQLGGMSQQALEIRGPKGNAFGMLEPHGGGWCAKRAGRIVLRIAAATDGNGLQAFSADSVLIATAGPEPGVRLTIQVSPGVDALLTLLCTLAVVLMSPDLAGMSA